MLEKHSAAEIGQYGYSHWSGRHPTPNNHEIYYVPQSIADGWEAYCSCGEWRCFINFYEIEQRDALIAKLRERHRLHCDSGNPE